MYEELKAANAENNCFKDDSQLRPTGRPRESLLEIVGPLEWTRFVFIQRLLLNGNNIDSAFFF